jgi:thiosulfate/3-mercaptopyruvate sulfurtransferase
MNRSRFCAFLLLSAAGGLSIVPGVPAEQDSYRREIDRALTQPLMPDKTEQMIAEYMREGRKRMEPDDLADRLMAGDQLLTVVDIRTPAEYAAFHIRGAVNLQPAGLASAIRDKMNNGTVVLYSNGMIHPKQVRDELYRQGFRNVYILTGGLNGFIEKCLKPASLRQALPIRDICPEKIRAWREYFLQGKSGSKPGP